MLTEILKPIGTTRGMACPGRFLLPLPEAEARVMAERGYLEIVESTVCRIVRSTPTIPRQGTFEAGSQPIEIRSDAVKGLVKGGFVEIVTGPEADEVHCRAPRNSKTGADTNAEAALARERAAKSRREAAKEIARDGLQKGRGQQAIVRLLANAFKFGLEAIRMTYEEAAEVVQEVAEELVASRRRGRRS